jgi:hypothetical protein
MKAGTQNHIKTKRLARLLKIPLYQGVGILESIWLLCIECCDEGNIGKFTDEEIAGYLEWERDASALIRALADSGWIDLDATDRFVIHDWLDHCPEFIRERLRKRRARGVKANKQTTCATSKPDNGGTNAGQAAACPVYSQPIQTQPIQTQPIQTTSSPAGADGESETATTDEFISSWNAAPGNCKARLPVSPDRCKALRARLRDAAWDWKTALAKFPLKCFGDDGWKPDLEWFLRPQSVTKILEGKYDWSKWNGHTTSRVGPGQRYQG